MYFLLLTKYKFVEEVSSICGKNFYKFSSYSWLYGSKKLCLSMMDMRNNSSVSRLWRLKMS